MIPVRILAATVAIFVTAATALADTPAAPGTPGTTGMVKAAAEDQAWVPTVVALVFAALLLAASMMSSKRTHQD
jgi:hypothetical protein